MNPGDRVRLIRLAPAVERLTYFADCLGKEGTVEEVKALVRFEGRAFWCNANEVEEVSA